MAPACTRPSNIHCLILSTYHSTCNSRDIRTTEGKIETRDVACDAVVNSGAQVPAKPLEKAVYPLAAVLSINKCITAAWISYSASSSTASGAYLLFI